MPRSVRIEYPGAFYHVMAWGNRKAAIFCDDDDRCFFLKTLAEACGMAGWRIHAWVMMKNHYHLVIETPEANLVEGMTWFQNAYTRRFNARHKMWGRLFGDRYKAVIVDGKSPDYYCTLLDYIHLNPARARLVKLQKGESLLDYPWSSIAGGYALPPSQRAKWLAVEAGLGAFGYTDTTANRRRFVEKLEKRAVEDGRFGVPSVTPGADQRMSHLRRGWYWGSQEFGESLLKRGEGAVRKPQSRGSASAGARKLHGIKRAEELLAEGLRRHGLKPTELKGTKGSDPRKIEIAFAIRSETTAPLAWIAEKLWMRSAANVSELLRREKRRKK